MHVKLLFLSLSVFFISCKHTDRKVENIRTFAKLYGYVRWFYPGDEASQIDWDKFAVYGVRKVENARNQKELKNILVECFKPIAPAIQIIDENQNVNFDLELITPNDTNGLNSIFWIHYGVYLGKESNIYKSVRNKRDTVNRSWTFISRLKPGEFIKKNIGTHLVVIMPLALYGSNEHTFPASDSISLKKLKGSLDQMSDSTLTTSDVAVKLANVVIAWNVFQHFYPYFDVVKVDWEKELSETLHNVYEGKTEPDYFKALSKMVAKLEDGHGVVFTNKITQWGLPFMVDWIENKIVVTGTSDTTSFQLGDIIANMDGKSAYEELLAQENLISGSPWLKRYRALNMFGSDFSQSEARIKIIRDDKVLTKKMKRQTRCNLFFNPLFKGNLFDFSNCGNRIYYFNSYSYDMKAVMDKLVGDTTAGTNGNVNFINLMGGYKIMWTGMKVLKHDGSQHHLVGFKPDYPISRTIKAIKDCRDEYLEKAIEILQEKVKK